MESQNDLMRFSISVLLACAKLFLTPSLSTADDVPLESLTEEPVNLLSFGIASLETHLRLSYLELCDQANCRTQDEEISVRYLRTPPNWWPNLSIAWPPDGVIVIRRETTRFGTDSSMATEKGCRLGLSGMAFANGGPDAPWMNYARFFIPRDDWHALHPDKKQVSNTLEQLKIISSRIVLLNIETHEWRTPPADIVDRKISVYCAGTLADSNLEDLDKIPIIGKYQWP